MRVTPVQQNNTRSNGVLKAGAFGAVAGSLVRNFAPLTTEEHNFYFNESAKKAIQDKVRKVRINETTSIAQEFAANKLNVSQDVFDVFEKNTQTIIDEPKKAMDLVQDSAEAVKNGFKTLVQRVDAVSTAKEHIEISNIKGAAKSSRPLAYFALAGALVAMTGKMLVNAFNDAAPKKETPKPKQTEPMTMADIMLQGLGSNAEILFLAHEAEMKK